MGTLLSHRLLTFEWNVLKNSTLLGIELCPPASEANALAPRPIGRTATTHIKRQLISGDKSYQVEKATTHINQNSYQKNKVCKRKFSPNISLNN